MTTSIAITEPTTEPLGLFLTEEAAEKVLEFIASSSQSAESSDTALRLGVRGGGCSGYQYALALDHAAVDDFVFTDHGVDIIASQETLPLIDGATIFWRDEGLSGSGFDVDNPQAVGGCGCGSSFRVDPEAQACGTPGAPVEESAL